MTRELTSWSPAPSQRFHATAGPVPVDAVIGRYRPRRSLTTSLATTSLATAGPVPVDAVIGRYGPRRSLTTSLATTSLATAGPVPVDAVIGRYRRPLARPRPLHRAIRCPSQDSAMAVPTPIYTTENSKAAYQLNWSLALFWRTTDNRR